MPKQRQISLLLLGAAAAGLAFLIRPAPGRGAGTLSLSIVSASTAMPSTTNFSTAQATVACPSGSTLVGGGDELTRSGSPVPNDGAVTLGLNPSDSSGNTVSGGTATPSNWTASAGYSGMAPGLDTVTAYGMCASGGPAATVIEAATTATDSLGPVTAVCPSGSSLVGGGGGYTSFAGSNNTKVFDSFPSDAAGDVPSDGATGPTAWTFQGNSNNATAETTTAIAFCATDAAVATQVAASSQTASAVAGGSTLADTVSCPSGTTLLGGGSVITDNPSGPGTGGQGVHVIGDYPSDGSGNPATGAAGSWTVIAEDGGQNLTSLGTEALALCATAPSGGGGGGGGGGGSTTTTTTTTASTTTPTTTTTATAPTSGSGPAAGTSNPAPSKTATLHSGKAGSLTVGAGAETVTISWPKTATGGTSLTAAPVTPFVPKSHGVPATTAAVQVVVGKGSKTLTHLGAPLELTFPGAPGNVTPAFTVDGTHWTAIPELGSSTLLPGLSDGWYRDKLGDLHILALHATIFGLLKSGAGLTAAREPAALGYLTPSKATLAGGTLKLSVLATRPGTLKVSLSRKGRLVSSWRRTLPGSGRLLQLPLSPAAQRAGIYKLELSLTAGGAEVKHTLTIQLSPPAT